MARIIFPSSIGTIIIEADEQGLTMVHLSSLEEVNKILTSSLEIENIKKERTLLKRKGKNKEKQRVEENEPENAAWHHIANACTWLSAYLSNNQLPPTPQLHLKGTSFQLRVWNYLQKIPYGTTTTYGAIARHIGKPKATQAVGQAVGANPIPFIIPCHRVLAVNGLGGYAYGLVLKYHLLALEHIVLL